MNFIKNLLLFSGICMTLSGCGKPDEYKYDMMIKNMASARSLFIGTKTTTPTKSKRSGGETTKALFMLKDDGYVEEVSYSYIDCKNGVCKPKKDAQINTPHCLFDVNDKFMMICFSNQPTNYDPYRNYNYLVNKETGRCYKMPYTFVPYYAFVDRYSLEARGISSRDIFMADQDGLIYFVCEAVRDDNERETLLKKLNLNNPDNITIENVSLKNDAVSGSLGPAVSSCGDIAYIANNNSSEVSRYVKKDGSFFNLDVSAHGLRSGFWTGYDGNIYCAMRRDDEYQIYEDIYKISERDGVIQYEKYGPSIKNYHYGSFGRVYLDSQKKIIQFDGESGILEIYNDSTNTTALITYESLGLKNRKIVSSSNEFVYLYGVDSSDNNVLVRLDPSNGYSKTTLMTSKYDLTSLVANKDDTVTFSGLRFSDGAYVVGTFDKDGNETIGDISLDKQVESLVNL